jgi:hypothetical protein
MFSICAPDTAAAVKLLTRLDTSVARVAMSARGIVAGGAGGSGSGGDSTALGGAGFSFSPAMTAAGEREQSTSRTKNEKHSLKLGNP